MSDEPLDLEPVKIKYKRPKTLLSVDDPVTMNQIRALASIQCTKVEAAHVLGVSESTLVKFFAAHEEARDEWKRGRSLGRVSLRRRQYQVAMAGDVPMLKHLGKQTGWLKQTDDPAKLAAKKDDAAQSVRRSRQEMEARLLELFARMPQLADKLTEIGRRANQGSGEGGDS